MIDPPTPDSVSEWVLGAVFGSPSLVVTTFVVINALWSWWTFGRGVVETTTALADRSHDRPARGSLKVGAAVRTGIAWLVLYIPASFATQLWAGSQYSPGQGGGLAELLQWSALFGAISVAGCAIIVPTFGPKHGDPNWAPLLGLFGGYAVGLIWAIIAFSLKNGPTPGDWWVCPALSCVGVLGACLRMRIRSIRSRSGSATPAQL